MGAELGGSYDPGPWKGFDYKSARAAYDATAGRGYTGTPSAKSAKSVKTPKSLDELVPASLKTDSPSPVVIAVDVTGSMKEWPKIIFEKLPLVDLGLKEYLDKPEICFMAIGDAYSDDYPLQVQPFAVGTDLVDRLKQLIPEGNGGGSKEESYDLAGVYATHNIKMAKASKPIFIFIGDEAFYPNVDHDAAEQWARVTLEGRVSSAQAIKDLQKRFSVYCIRKLYDQGSGDAMSETDKVIHKQWTDYLGADHVAILNEPRRVCDVILGVVAKETDNLAHFTQELKDRQTPEQVRTVMQTMKTLIAVHALPDPGKSVMRSKGGKKSNDLA
ncbi:hypothetical protein HY642_02005 [Candidatus Woesearchaeota archaeon]|nr:hypothetical protein [Candidatus Woesearchaeota archaeon]